ncbi:RNA polymerase sigma factor SigJ [Paractinoplanes brasiliensis]|uniref:RNA polymerase sigma-70 factor (ECF subfamily) n=1 Tax=Paractinoplanes brasiliensis TaxID=52695 RepID=A0A4R6JYV6_9ACTN|nr:RNA polymerase sigma factor SigJ [Actinoplanes brasiliensis]TDO39975.1 RNA polymerase sigma-70 factor (ECF subfamily) [Actinoplanes brasiliensis]GID25040.1 RNA polymerase sigma factor SigJ [Actinoplanes brasiliensis]
MPPSAEAFEAERSHLVSVAYRMLGSVAEAQDVVQEAWLRYTRASDQDIRDLRGWLTTVTGRLCLDVLKSARVSREAYTGMWLPEYFVDPDAGPAAQAEQRDQVGLALLVVLERLSPEQRVALVLHDAFGVPYDEVARVLGTTEAAARQHASRGRRAAAEGGVRHTAGPVEQRRVLAAFVDAVNSGDLAALASVLAPDVVSISDGGGFTRTALRPIVGADKVARFFVGIAHGGRMEGAVLEPVLVNGTAGLLVRGEKAYGALGLTIADGRITGLFQQLNPAKLSVSDSL